MVSCAFISWPDGRKEQLLTNEKRTFGRADVSHLEPIQACFVGRHGVLSQAPSLHVRMQQGATSLLHSGDRFALLATRPQDAITVSIEAGPATGDQGAPLHDARPQIAGGVVPLQAQDSAAGLQQQQQQQVPGNEAATSLVIPYVAKADGYAQASSSIGANHKAKLAGPKQPTAGSAASALEHDAGLQPGHTCDATIALPSKRKRAAPEAGPAAAAATATAEQRALHAEPSGTPHEGTSTAPAGPVMLLLVGIPGSGKSTFSQELLRRSPLKWVAVNQDSIHGGKKGNKVQCLRAARAALSAGSNCVIDRCNADQSQRGEFLQLASELQLPAYAVVLELPTQVCVSRIQQRAGHPTLPPGKHVSRVVGMMSSSMSKPGARPSIAEGLRGIMECKSAADVQAALEAWCGLGAGRDPWQEWQARHSSFRAAAGAAGPLAAAFRAPVTKGPAPEHPPPPKRQCTTPSHPDAAAPQQVTNTALQHTPTSTQPPSTAAGTDMPPAGPACGSQQPAAPAQDAAPLVMPGRSGRMHQEGLNHQGTEKGLDHPGTTGLNAFQVLLKSRGQPSTSPPSSKAAAAAAAAAAGAGTPAAGHQHAAAGRWDNALLGYIQHADRYAAQNPRAMVDELCMVVEDKYPKARHHMLVIPRRTDLDRVTDVRPEHLPLLEHMCRVTKQWIARHAPHEPFQMGFHSIPSMRLLHMHVISQDFDSPCLKKKEHWNSFTTAFFLPVEQVMSEVREKGRVEVDMAAMEQLKKSELRCHRCHQRQANLPTLKKHIATCAPGHSP